MSESRRRVTSSFSILPSPVSLVVSPVPERVLDPASLPVADQLASERPGGGEDLRLDLREGARGIHTERDGTCR